MLDVGFSEILLTSAIALIVLGPERLPKVARQVGNWMGRARAMARQLSEQLEREVNAEELLKIQSKPNPGTNPPVAAEPPAIAPDPPAIAPDPLAITPDPPAIVAEPPAISPEPVYGAPASMTTPEAMHANDPPVAAAATDPKPPHE